MTNTQRKAQDAADRMLPRVFFASRVIGACAGFLALWYWIPVEWAWPLRILTCAVVVVASAFLSRFVLVPIVLAMAAAQSVRQR